MAEERIILDPESRFCKTCDYWKPISNEEDETRGRCHRYPPQGLVVNDRIIWKSPLTFVDFPCGEHVNKLSDRFKIEVEDGSI